VAVPEWILQEGGACPAGGFGRCQVPGASVGCEIR